MCSFLSLNNVCVHVTTTTIRRQNSYLTLKIPSYCPFAVKPSPPLICINHLIQGHFSLYHPECKLLRLAPSSRQCLWDASMLCVYHKFLSFPDWALFHCTDVRQFVGSFVERHLDGFQFSKIMNNATLNSRVGFNFSRVNPEEW